MNIESRLSKLEAKAPVGDDWKVFRVIGRSDEECQAAIDRLVASGEARPHDRFLSRIIVAPPMREGLRMKMPRLTWGRENETGQLVWVFTAVLELHMRRQIAADSWRVEGGPEKQTPAG